MKSNYLLAVILILSSCTSEFQEPPQIDNDLIENEVQLTTTIPDTTFNVTQSKAAVVATMFADRISPASRNAERTVKEILIIPDSEGIPMMYVVNFQNQAGFVIVSATKKFYPVIAHSETGNYTIGNTKTSPSDFFLGEKIPYIKACDARSKEEAADFIRQWRIYDNETLAISRNDSRAADIPQVYYDSLKRWSTTPNTKVYRYNEYIQTFDYSKLDQSTKNAIYSRIHYLGNSQYGTVEDVTLVVIEDVTEPTIIPQLMQTLWQQRNGFNKYVPNYYPLGCSSIAAGQIMKHHGYPTYIDWDAMHNIYATNQTATFLYELSQHMKTKYDSIGSSAYLSNIKLALESYRYTVKSAKHNAADVESDLKFSKPILMTGVDKNSGGHAWVCDGMRKYKTYSSIRFMTLEYRPTPYTTPTTMVEAYQMTTDYNPGVATFHMNWGWGGFNDGYFYDSDISIPTGSGALSFNENRYNLINIHPNL